MPGQAQPLRLQAGHSSQAPTGGQEGGCALQGDSSPLCSGPRGAQAARHVLRAGLGPGHGSAKPFRDPRGGGRDCQDRSHPLQAGAGRWAADPRVLLPPGGRPKGKLYPAHALGL